MSNVIPTGTPQALPQAAPTGAPGATPGAEQSQQLQEMLTRLLKRSAQPPMVGPQPPERAMQSLQQPPSTPQMLTKGVLGLAHDLATRGKKAQLEHATQRILNIGRAISAAYETAQGDPEKAHYLFTQSPEYQSMLSKEGQKDAKQMEKLLQYDFLNPEKGKTVWHEALERAAKIMGAEKTMKGIRELMGKHKDKMAEEVRKQGEAQHKQEEARSIAETMFKGAQPLLGADAKGQLTPAQELKTVMDSIKEERQRLAQDRTAADREAALAEHTKEFDEKQKQQKDEFDQREKLMERRETAWEETRRQMVKMAGDRLKLAGANYELRRIVIGANYIPNMLTPEQQQAVGLQIDEDGNPIPLKSPLSATALTRNANQQAGVMDNLIDTTLKMLDSPELQNKLGPYSGRLSEIIQGKIGKDVPEFDVLRTLGSFDNTGMLKLHFGSRGGTQMYTNFKSLLDTGKMDADSLKATLQGYKTVAGAYKKEISTVREKGAKGEKDESGDVVIDLRKTAPKKP